MKKKGKKKLINATFKDIRQYQNGITSSYATVTVLHAVSWNFNVF